MNEVEGFGKTARGLARNPLGIIALFIVLVYGFACIVSAFAGSFTPQEKVPLIYFLVIFPVVVLIAFCWLVSKHSNKLFAPQDFRNEDNYVKMQMSAVAALSLASAKGSTSEEIIVVERVVEAVQSAKPKESKGQSRWSTRVLWVDDNPGNNAYEREAFQAVGISFELAENTDDALSAIKRERFAAIISDMERREGPREGYKLLDTLRRKGVHIPFFIYAASNASEHKEESSRHGGQGCTNSPQELFEMVVRAVFGESKY